MLWQSCGSYQQPVAQMGGFSSLYLTCSVDPFSKKDWYDVKAPSMFAVRNVGKTLVTRTQGTKVSS